MTLIVTVPPSYREERLYILSVMLKEFLGLEYQVAYGGPETVSISQNSSQASVTMPDCLFATPAERWLTPASLPKQPLESWDPFPLGIGRDIVPSPVPVIFGVTAAERGGIDSAGANNQVFVPIDIFGSCFFMLTRYEEVAKGDRDEHDRFPTDASLAKLEGFVERPIVNEYVEILWVCLKQLWPSLRRREREYRLCLSHDVDQTLCVVAKPPKQVGKRILGDLVVRRDPSLAYQSARAALIRDPKCDPCNTFDLMMDVSEKCGTASAFYFMTDLGDSPYDGRYDIDHPWTRKLIRRIVERGHTIGFHPTYGSYLMPERLRSEFQRLRRAADEEGARQDSWGGRQHFLRWQNPATWQHWEDAGIDFDSTVGFADAIGFRAGCCYEYPVFNLGSRMQLRLTEKPLIFMEVAVLSGDGSEREYVFETAMRINEICRKFKGDFTLLWHNSNIISRVQKDAYASLIESL